MKYFCKRMKYFLLLSKELLKTFFWKIRLLKYWGERVRFKIFNKLDMMPDSTWSFKNISLQEYIQLQWDEVNMLSANFWQFSKMFYQYNFLLGSNILKFDTFRWYKWGGFWWSGAQGDLWLDRGTPSSSSTWSHCSTRLSRVIKQNQVKIGVVSRALLVEESCWFENSLEGWKLWAYLFNWENKQKIDWVFVGLNTNMILCSHKYWFNL